MNGAIEGVVPLEAEPPHLAVPRLAGEVLSPRARGGEEEEQEGRPSDGATHRRARGRAGGASSGRSGVRSSQIVAR